MDQTTKIAENEKLPKTPSIKPLVSVVKALGTENSAQCFEIARLESLEVGAVGFFCRKWVFGVLRKLSELLANFEDDPNDQIGRKRKIAQNPQFLG